MKRCKGNKTCKCARCKSARRRKSKRRNTKSPATSTKPPRLHRPIVRPGVNRRMFDFYLHHLARRGLPNFRLLSIKKNLKLEDFLFWTLENYSGIDVINIEDVAISRCFYTYATVLCPNRECERILRKKRRKLSNYGNPISLLHGTRAIRSLDSFFRRGFLPSNDGLLGSGVYFSPHYSKAYNYSAMNFSLVVVAQVFVRSVFDIDKDCADKINFGPIAKQYDATRLRRMVKLPNAYNGRILNGDEYCVYNNKFCVPEFAFILHRQMI